MRALWGRLLGVIARGYEQSLDLTRCNDVTNHLL